MLVRLLLFVAVIMAIIVCWMLYVKHERDIVANTQYFTLNYEQKDTLSRSNLTLVMSECVAFDKRRYKISDIRNAYFKAINSQGVGAIDAEFGCVGKHFLFYDGSFKAKTFNDDTDPLPKDKKSSM